MIEKSHLSQNLKVLKNTGKEFLITGFLPTTITKRASDLEMRISIEKVITVNIITSQVYPSTYMVRKGIDK